MEVFKIVIKVNPWIPGLLPNGASWSREGRIEEGANSDTDMSR